MFLENGSLKIIDRKKNIYKLSQGEYVAPEKVQNIYIRCEEVAECFVYGDSLRDYNVAIVHPNLALLPQIAQRLNISERNAEKLCQMEEVKEFIVGEMMKQAKKDGLFGFQMAKKVTLWPVSFGTYGVFTSTMKLQRHIAKKAFKEEIDRMYGIKTLPKL